MGLKEYQEKRDFSRTAEPEGKIRKGNSGRLYIIQKHAATRLHYDLRLELNGVLKSWAVPKGPSFDPDERRLAVQVEDHPIEYASFEGIIPEGEYGGGTVMLWDRGEWQPHGSPENSLRRGRLSFDLKGEKLNGSWALARMHGEAGEEGKNWLLIKKRDESARPLSDYDILEDQTLSVATGRSMEEIAAVSDKVWRGIRPDEKTPLERREDEMARTPETKSAKTKLPDPSTLPNARKARQPEEFRPELATLVSDIPKGDKWLHEIKYDGYRILCIISHGDIRLLTRHGNNWTAKFGEIAQAGQVLRLKEAILDGEIVVLNPDGTTDFQALQNVLKGVATGRLVYYVFDIPHCSGYDLTQTPLVERKEFLRRVFNVAEASSSIRYGDYIQGGGASVFQNACRYAIEGMVSKRADARYVQRRTHDWVKVKCLKRQEFVVGGFTDPSGSRTGFGALLLGYYENKDLIFSGRVGTGFNEQTLTVLFERLSALEKKATPFKNPPTGYEARGVHWISPELVVDVEFMGWTNEGILRHPSFKGLREDKPPTEVVREIEEPPPGEEPKTKEIRREEPKRREAMPKKEVTDKKVAGITLSNPDRILYPEQGITKRQLALYYERIAEWVLPYMIKRPLTLVRCPRGHQKQCFYQKHLEEAIPDTVRGVPIQEKDDEGGVYIVIDDLAGLISLVQLGVLEFHPWAARDDDIEHPDMMVFDLDPGPDVEWEAVIRGAQLLHERLDDLRLESFVKTTGGKGFHVVVPLIRRAGWDEMKAFSKALAEDVVRAEPNKYVATMSKAKRKGKIFVDYVRNTRGATSVAAYSTRARPGAPVSTPLFWDEISKGIASDAYTIENLPERLESLKKDPWESFFAVKQSITKAMKERLGMKEKR